MTPEGKKYFFDLNNFGESSRPEPEENLPPPPPVFSEDELSAAKHSSYDEGHRTGLETGRQEEQQSRAQYIATQISELNTQILSLVLSEQMREKKFEQEVIHLTRTLVSKLFPALTQKGGYQEVEHIVARVLARQTASKILIEVPKEDAEDIKTYLLSLKDIEPGRVQITGVDDLSKGSCRMKWQDGGAVRDHEALAASIFAELDEVLAPPPQKGQNRESHTESAPQSADPPVKEELVPDNGEEHG